MRWMGMISSVIVLFAVALGFNTLSAFGFDFGEIAWLVLPVAVGVGALVVVLFYFGRWSARMLADADSERERSAKD